MAQWLTIVSWGAVILGLLTALAIAFDVAAHPQHMKIMNVVWPITGLYLPVLGWLLYTDMARRKPMSISMTCMPHTAGVRSGKACLSRRHTAPRAALLATSSARQSCLAGWMDALRLAPSLPSFWFFLFSPIFLVSRSNTFPHPWRQCGVFRREGDRAR